MTRKDYQLIASAIVAARAQATRRQDATAVGRNSFSYVRGHSDATIFAFDRVVETLVTALHADNNQFDADKFRTACNER